MNITIRMIFSALVIFIGYMVVYLLGQPLEGMRGAPWFNYYVFEMPLVGLVVITVVLCILSPAVGDAVAVFCGSWIRGGGFWAVASKNNIPGNTWIVIALVLAFNAITYGPPTPKVDWGKIKHGAQVSVQKNLNQPNVLSGAKNTVNYLSSGLLGQEFIPTLNSQPILAEPIPRYQKGWWRIWAALLAALFAPLVWVWGRRNDLADKVASIVDVFRGHRETRGSATSDSGKSASGSLMNKLLKQTGPGEQVTSHLIGEFLSRIAETLLGGFAKMMKRY